MRRGTEPWHGHRGEPVARLATVEDAAAIAAIYNQGIEDRTATFETDFRSAGDVSLWFDASHPIVVVEDGAGGQVVGFASTSTYRPRRAYAGIAEFSVYVARGSRRHGVGRAAMLALADAAARAGFWKLVSRVMVTNMASRGLLASVGFREVGIYRRHARLDGIWRDVVVVELLVGEAAEATWALVPAVPRPSGPIAIPIPSPVHKEHSMPKEVLRNPGLVFKPLPFSPAVEANGIVWLAGQCGHAPGETVAVAGGIQAETRQALENIGVTLHAIGLDYKDVVNVSIFMTNMNDFSQMNEVYRDFFASDFPARVTVGVARLASNYSIEIVVIAAR